MHKQKNISTRLLYAALSIAVGALVVVICMIWRYVVAAKQLSYDGHLATAIGLTASAESRLLASDHESILLACRDLLRRKNDLRQSRPGASGRDEMVFISMRDRDPNDIIIPTVLKDLQPTAIWIKTNSVCLDFIYDLKLGDGLKCEAFAETVEGSGDTKLHDGLWMSSLGDLQARQVRPSR